MFLIINESFCGYLVLDNEYLVSSVNTDNLLLQYQGINEHSAE